MLVEFFFFISLSSFSLDGLADEEEVEEHDDAVDEGQGAEGQAVVAVIDAVGRSLREEGGGGGDMGGWKQQMQFFKDFLNIGFFFALRHS